MCLTLQYGYKGKQMLQIMGHYSKASISIISVHNVLPVVSIGRCPVHNREPSH